MFPGFFGVGGGDDDDDDDDDVLRDGIPQFGSSPRFAVR